MQWLLTIKVYLSRIQSTIAGAEMKIFTLTPKSFAQLGIQLSLLSNYAGLVNHGSGLLKCASWPLGNGKCSNLSIEILEVNLRNLGEKLRTRRSCNLRSLPKIFSEEGCWGKTNPLDGFSRRIQMPNSGTISKIDWWLSSWRFKTSLPVDHEERHF